MGIIVITVSYRNSNIFFVKKQQKTLLLIRCEKILAADRTGINLIELTLFPSVAGSQRRYGCIAHTVFA